MRFWSFGQISIWRRSFIIDAVIDLFKYSLGDAVTQCTSVLVFLPYLKFGFDLDFFSLRLLAVRHVPEAAVRSKLRVDGGAGGQRQFPQQGPPAGADVPAQQRRRALPLQVPVFFFAPPSTAQKKQGTHSATALFTLDTVRDSRLP